MYENIDDLPFVLEAALCVSMPQLIGVYLSVRINKDKVDKLHSKLQEIVDKGIEINTKCLNI